MGEADDILGRAFGSEIPETPATTTVSFPDPLDAPEVYAATIQQFSMAHQQGPDAVIRLYDEKIRAGWSPRFLTYTSIVSLTRAEY